MAEHGLLFDNFTRQSSHPHGGSYFDAGFGQQAHVDTHGRLHDLFGVPQDPEAHGQHFDEFGWRDLPPLHGQHFDTDFATPTAHDTEHGTWYDVFRGGIEVRFILDGADYEGTVIECNRDYAKVRSRDGQEHEVGLTQFMAYRSPNEQQDSPEIPASTAHAPSAHNPTAHGNFGTTGTPALTAEPSVTEHVSPGPGNTDHRTGTPDGLFDTFTHLKSVARRLDVTKTFDTAADVLKAISLDEVGDGSAVAYNAAPNGNRIEGTIQLHLNGVYGVETEDGDTFLATGDQLDLVKSVDSTETATQAQDLDKGDSKHAWCPHCEHECKKVTSQGTCPTCGTKVSVGKANTGDLGIEVPEREHKSTDHHSSGKKPGVCPHCGGALEELDHQTEQGQPSRTHKCLGSTLDVLKTLAEV